MGGGRGGMGTPPTMPGGQTGGQRDDRSERRPQTPRNLTVRWESAAPVQTAHLKLHESDVPTVDESHYAIVVAGIPNRMAQSDAKPKAELKRKGQKTIKSSEAKMIPRDNGNLVIFFFPRSREITLKDQQVDFEGRIGVMEVNQSFDVTAMQLDGKLQL